MLLKNDSNKSCSELNFLQKSQWSHMSVSPIVELGTSKIAFLKYYSALKRKSKKFNSEQFVLLNFFDSTSTELRVFFGAAWSKTAPEL